MPARLWATGLMGLGLVLTQGVPNTGNAQQGRPRPQPSEIVGTLGPAAARALGNPWKGADVPPPIHPERLRAGGSPSLGHVFEVPIRVIDAASYPRGGSTLVYQELSPQAVIDNRWFPSGAPPKWRVIQEERPVQAWRVVDVEDVVCRANGTCMALTTRMLARWAPRLRSYAFVDRVGRIWAVE